MYKNKYIQCHAYIIQERFVFEISGIVMTNNCN